MGIMKPWKFSDRVFFIGSQQNYYTFPSFSLQSWYAKDVIFGNIKVPSLEEQFSWINKKKDEYENCVKDFAKLGGSVRFGANMTPEQKQKRLKLTHKRLGVKSDYFAEMASATDHPSYNAKEAHDFWVEYLLDRANCKNILQYRDNNYTSLYTKESSVPWDKQWIDEIYNFSLEEYYDRCKNLMGNKNVNK